MTPKEKADNIMDLIFKRTYHIKSEDAKQCALIAVDEIIKDREKLFEHYWIDLKYWQEVKQEIEKL